MEFNFSHFDLSTHVVAVFIAVGNLAGFVFADPGDLISPPSHGCRFNALPHQYWTSKIFLNLLAPSRTPWLVSWWAGKVDMRPS